jgi:arylsulfatase A
MEETQMPKKSKISRRDFLKGSLAVSGILAVGGLGYRAVYNHIRRDFDPARSQAYLDSIQPVAKPKDLPNIIIIFTDDLGYGDLGAYGNSTIKTPSLDRMAAEGARLTQFYSTAPLCSPARAGLLTGRYPIRTMVTGALYPTGSPMNTVVDLAGFYTLGMRGIPEDEVLLSEILKRRGYKTGIVGKWHLGDRSPHLPNDNGFDQFYGALYSNDMKRYQIFRDDQIEIDRPVDQNQLTHLMTEESLRFIQNHKESPFFLYLAHPMPHEPIHASEEFRGTSAAGLYGDTIEEIDWSVGKILESIQRLGLDDRTLIFFTSDNGPWWQGNPGPMRGRKILPFEGGFRVPLIARWPGMIPEGIVRHEMSMNFDLFATCLQVAGVNPPTDRAIEGVNILPLLKGESIKTHETLYYFKGRNLVGVRHHDWKYLRRHMTDNGGYATLSQGPFLFNLATDPNESYSMIESEPEIASQLLAMLDAFDLELKENIRGWQ